MSVILVGVDDSPAAAEAVRWAAHEAALRGAPLHVMHAWELPRFAGWEDAPVTREGLQAESSRILDGLTARAAEGQPGIDVSGVSVEGAPAAELIAAAGDADLLVVGSRGEGGFTGLLLGSVSHQCALHAPCPVVIVRG
jgi:nucleotide-binding universal stress UspA family protein